MADFAVRGFAVHRTDSRAILERHARAFLLGFNTVVAGPDIVTARDRLTDPEWVAEEERGFAFEGAGMAGALLDILTPSRTRRVRALLDGPGARYPHLIHVGTGGRWRTRGFRAAGPVCGSTR